MIVKKLNFLAIIAISSILLISSCTTEFERVRTSNDPKEILSKAHEYYNQEKYLNAQTLYELAIQYYRGKTEAEELFFKYAYTFYNLGEYISASHYFNSFSSTFYNSEFREEAAFMSAFSHYKMSPLYKLDQSYSAKAIESFQDFTNNFPNSDRVAKCNELMDEMRLKMEQKLFAQGKLYYDIGQYQAAVVTFQNFMTGFPGADREAEAKYLLVKSSYVLAENSIVSKRKERYEDAKKLAQKYLDKLGNRKYKKDVSNIIKNINAKLKEKA